ncbi:DNA (cytosine-5)-methyltransferase 1 [Salinibacterium sp. CAN_S4]|uniref:DNA (cytosine-5-)-methyltransferase n=1 Tax=Salinibacterium sp. CAN_S4 TaxID=2787727 RepID=UPI0018EF77A4
MSYVPKSARGLPRRTAKHPSSVANPGTVAAPTSATNVSGERRGKYPLRAIDLFSGAGGLSQGFRDAGYEIPFALDFDADSCATYEKNHPDTHVECASITDFTPAQIKKLAGGRVDVVLGGPSCQSFSTAGRRSGWVADGDERNDLWEHMFKVVEHLRPKAFLMENVPGMVYWKEGAFGDKVLKRFTEIGYSVRKEILLAADWGVPQRRRRLFIVGVLGDEPFAFPEPTHMGGWRRDALEMWETKRKAKGLLPHLTVDDAIGDLPPLETGVASSSRYSVPKEKATPFAKQMRGSSRTVRDHEVQPLATDTASLISHVPAGGTWRDVPPHLLPDRYRGMRRTDSTNLLGRLDWNLPSYTITTQFNNVTTGCFTHPTENRSLSVREGARLQTFPDSYEFIGSIGSRCRQIGNAVPPLLASVLAHEIAVQVWGVRAKSHHPRPAVMKRGVATQSETAIDEVARARMKKEAYQDTAAERGVRDALSAAGVPFTLSARTEETARLNKEILIEDAKVVVLVSGCFLHGCEKHSRSTKSSTKWWADKIHGNVQRDAVSRELWRTEGWEIVEFWEHEDPQDCIRHIHEVIAALRTGSSDHLITVSTP